MDACGADVDRRPKLCRLLPPQGDIIVKQLDLSDLASVKRFAKDFLATERGPHLLILNAGKRQLHAVCPGNACMRAADLPALSCRCMLRPASACMRAADVPALHAGVMACPQSYTQDGFEMQIGEHGRHRSKPDFRA
jgi:NAD(P)-dependent dehydrogenase (short-subunit alcohol dehydrogenase family)